MELAALPDPQRAFAEASLALSWVLDTPRVHAILASSYNAFGDRLSAAAHIKTHIDMVTTELISTNPLDPGTTDTKSSCPAAPMRSRSLSLPDKRSRSRPATTTTGTRSWSCWLQKGHPSLAPTTPISTSPPPSGLPK